MPHQLDAALNDLWLHLTADRQAWLFGAGISRQANIPLMYPLTTYVQTLVSERSPPKLDLLAAIRADLPSDSHIEHVLSHLGDLIAVAGRSRTGSTQVAGIPYSTDSLRELHELILSCIGDAVRFGYSPASEDHVEVRGTQLNPIVKVDQHRRFLRQLLVSRSKPGFQQTPISFFTTNYDTLIEDALALERVPFSDGFIGGAMAYWAPDQAFADQKPHRVSAKVFKLHGSVDWHLLDEGYVVRCRSGCSYPKRDGNLLIYPQSTKYVATQKDPFAALFSQFRAMLARGPDNVLAICGYSFGDDHIDHEIEAAMSQPHCKTVLVAFAEEKLVDGQFVLPSRLRAWLSDRSWRERVFVASSRGLYHGSLLNLCGAETSKSWWTFEGLTNYLSDGPDVTPGAGEPGEAVGADGGAQE